MSDRKKKEFYLDFEGAIKILEGRGINVSIKETANQIGYSQVGMMKLRKKAPKAIEMLAVYLQENVLRFEDLVKQK